MSNRAWMPLHIDEYIADTDHLTATEHGAYLLLIMKYWRDGGLPDDEGMIRRYAKLTSEQWAESRGILAAFFENGWRHKRIDAELAKAEEIIEKRRSAADARHGKSKPDASAVQVQSTCTYTGASPLTDNLSDVGADAPTSPEPEKSAPDAKVSPTAIELPSVSGEPYPISEADVAEWHSAFPAVDVRQQLSAMRQWLIANPTRRKTRKGMRRFVVAWLDRKQNSAHSPPAQRTSPDPPHPMHRVNAILDEIQGKPHAAQSQPHTIDGSFERADRSSAPNLVQFHAVSAWGRS